MKLTAHVGTLVLLGTVAGSALAQQHPNVERGFAPGKAYQAGEIDAINLFNGNLTLSVPIGQSYSVGGGLSYGLTLHYNSNVWEYEQVSDYYCPPTGGCRNIEGTQASPSPKFNAGLGWTLSFGSLASSSGPLVEPIWTYTTPDTADHAFYKTLHEGEPLQAITAFPCSATSPCKVYYTRDGTYLRLVDYSQNTPPSVEIDFPDGTVHTYEKDAQVTQWRIKQIRDQFNNYLSFTYLQTPPAPAPPTQTQWTLTDSQGRTHVITFGTDALLNPRLDKVEFAGGPTYLFYYQDQKICRSGKRSKFRADIGNLLGITPDLTVTFLAGVKLPDNSSYCMNSDCTFVNFDVTAFYNVIQNPPGSTSVCDWMWSNFSPPDKPGTLSALRLPTGGVAAWTYTVWTNPYGPAGDACYPLPWQFPAFSTSTGVATRQFQGASGVGHDTWTYTHDSPHNPDGSLNLYAEQAWTTVRSPESDDTKNFFRTRYCLGTTPSQLGWDYGLPFSKHDDLNQEVLTPPYRSVEVYKSLSGAGNLLRTAYLQYDHDVLPLPPGLNARWYDSNRRITTQRTVYHDDLVGGFAVWGQADHSDFDGLGHFRQADTSGTFADTTGNVLLGNNVRTTKTHYNPSAGTYPAGFSLPSITSPWVINTYDYQRQTEGTTTAEQQFCFDPATGFLRAKRILSGATALDTDLLAVFTPDRQGNVATKQYFGGDAQLTAPPTSYCFGPFAPLSGHQYRIDHIYPTQANLWKRQSWYTDLAGNPLSFKLVDQDIDPNTGVVLRSRDAAGIQRRTRTMQWEG